MFCSHESISKISVSQEHGKIFDNRGDVVGLGKNPQNGVALSNVTPFTRCGQDAAKYRATNPPREFPTM